MAKQQQRQRRQQQNPGLLQLEGPPNDGVNIGTAVNVGGIEYRWEGDVKNKFANGFGKQTILSGNYKGGVIYGEFKDGFVWGNQISKDPDGEMFFRGYEKGRWKRADDFYNNNNAIHKATLDKAEEKSAAAHALVCVPWSRKTNHFGKWKPKQAMIETVLLLGERLHRRLIGSRSQSPTLLHALPVEIWEMIIRFLLD
eukprot:m.82040 g.82040  ORF g.82040 m.82040 type:complete len:198 (-) comp12850_c0_seq2:164-757(-)